MLQRLWTAGTKTKKMQMKLSDQQDLIRLQKENDAVMAASFFVQK